MITAIFVLLAQQASAKLEAQYDPAVWTVEHPAIIGGIIDEYYNCLRSGEYVIGEGLGFEAQYRADIPRCAERGAKLEAEANTLLSRRSQADAFGPEETARLFEGLRKLHVARGASLDRSTRTRIVSSRAYEAASSEDAQDRSCVAYVNALRAERDRFAATEGARVKVLYDKSDYTDQDRKAVTSYNEVLMRLTADIQLELRACPEANYALNETMVDGDAAAQN